MNPKSFILLRHTNHPVNDDHYDLLLEEITGDNPEEDVLLKYETPEINNDDLDIVCHGMFKRKHLDYESPRGKNVGIVEIIEKGIYEFLVPCSVKFDGQVLQGVYSFQKDDKSTGIFELATLLKKTS